MFRIQTEQQRATCPIFKMDESDVTWTPMDEFAKSHPTEKEESPSVCHLELVPNEILSSIFAYLPQTSLCALMPISRTFNAIAAPLLYNTPYFASTYRFAQFSRTVGCNSSYANLVSTLDMSYIEPPAPRGTDTDSSDSEDMYYDKIPSQAGWRELRALETDLYYLEKREQRNPPFDYSPNSTLRASNKILSSWKAIREEERRGTLDWKYTNPLGSFRKSSHPPPSPLLGRFEKVRDVPIGSVVRVLAACENLRNVNLSRIVLERDYLVLQPGENKSAVKPHTSFLSTVPLSAIHPIGSASPSTAQPSIIPTQTLSPLTHAFLTDAPEPHRFLFEPLGPRANEIQVYPDEIVFWLSKLRSLEKLEVKGCGWFTTARAWMLFCARKGVIGDRSIGGERRDWLREVDFKGCGMGFGESKKWTFKGSKEKVYKVLEALVRNGELDAEERRRRNGVFCGA